MQFPTKSQAMSPSAAAAQERSAISFFLPHKQEVRPQVALCITPGGRSKSSPYCASDDDCVVDDGDDGYCVVGGVRKRCLALLMR